MGPKRRIGLGLMIGVVILLAGYQLGFKNFAEHEKTWRSRLRRELVTRFAEDAAEAAAHFGLHDYQPPRLPRPKCAPQGRAVVLVHGLDDPGKVWMNLAPALATQGHQVLQLYYPNDQPIHDSAVFMATCLKGLPSHGVNRVIIVAHSMGGLVSREMLTHPDINYSARVTAKKAPMVGGLIMVGTPNQGVEIARLRVFSEFREQISRGLVGQGHWLGWLVDGAGEAKIDLLPESSFLTALNGRRHPQDVNLLTIAGIATPGGQEKPPARENPASGSTSAQPQGQWSKAVARVAMGVGDGLVPVDAVRLEGVDFLTVPGSHLTMIRNITAENPRTPPAVPLILEKIRLWEATP